jgi:DNA-directed RNA polymerase subunit RPC12/RpoP
MTKKIGILMVLAIVVVGLVFAQNATVCRYCGLRVSNAFGTLRGPFDNGSCSASPIRRHVLVADGIHCVYCGLRVSNAFGTLRGPYDNGSCSASPTGKHLLDR